MTEAYISDFANLNGALLFAYGAVENTDSQLWITSGTNASAQLITTLPGSEIDPPTNVNGTLFFRVNDSLVGQELWKNRRH